MMQMDVMSVPEVEIDTSYDFSGSLVLSIDDRDIDKLRSGRQVMCDTDDFTVTLTPVFGKRKPKPTNHEYLDRTYRPPTAWEAEVFGGLARV